jgi:hypothetical protein
MRRQRRDIRDMVSMAAQRATVAHFATILAAHAVAAHAVAACTVAARAPASPPPSLSALCRESAAARRCCSVLVRLCVCARASARLGAGQRRLLLLLVGQGRAAAACTRDRTSARVVPRRAGQPAPRRRSLLCSCVALFSVCCALASLA